MATTTLVWNCDVQSCHGCGAGVIPECEVDSSQIPVRNAAKCLGYWWRGDMTASRSVEENTRRACKSFFHWVLFRETWAPYQQDPSLRHDCVMSILLFGSENWIVSGGILEQLESFLGELAKRALKWPRHFSNTAAMTVLDLDSVTSRIVVWKLRFLKRHLAVGACRGYQYS